MQHLEMLSKAIRYQKIASDNTFSLLSIFQDSSERMLKRTLDSSLIPPKSKEGCLAWTSNCRQATETIKDFVDKGYEEAERLLKQPGKPEQQPKKAPAAQQEKKAPAKKAKPKSAARKTTAAPKKAASAQKKPTPAQKKATPAAKPATQKTSLTAAAEKVEAKAENQVKTPAKQAAPSKPEAQKSQENTSIQK